MTGVAFGRVNRTIGVVVAILCPPGAPATPWANRFGSSSAAFASGWMALRGIRRRRGADKGFVVSDHADWDGLNSAIRATGADVVLYVNGGTDTAARTHSPWRITAGNTLTIEHIPGNTNLFVTTAAGSGTAAVGMMAVVYS
jgi:hypothetical protein